MSVEIDPLELAFRRPFTVEVAQILRIKNPNTAPVAFKVKTTAPKQYCVRPNSGRIEPGHEVEVSVLLQAMKQEPPLDAKCRDKFLVQSVTITGDKEFTNVSQIWDAVEKSAIQEKKIRVAWLPPSDEGRLQPAATPLRRPASNGVDATPDTAPPAYSSPHEDTTIMDDTAEQPMPKPQPRQQETPEATQQSTQSSTTFSAAVPPAAAAAVASTIKSAATAETYDDLRDKLAQAEAMIASLKKEMAGGGGGGGGLRQRKGGVSDEAAATGEKAGTQQQLVQAERQPRGTEGVPVQVVALLCLVSFLLAYFFF